MQLVEDGIVLRARVAVLEIGAAGAADQQRIAGEYPVGKQERIRIVGVARRVEHVETHAFDADVVAFGDAHGDDVGLGVLAHHGDAMGAVAQRAKPGDVIGVQMRVYGLHQPEIELAHELQIALDALEDRIDDQRLAAAPAGEEIGVGAGRAVEELAEDHARLLMRPRRPQCGGSEDRTERYAVDAALQPSGLKTRWLDGGNFASFAAGRIGRRTQFAAAIRAASLEQAVGAVAAERALERADNGVMRIGRQIPVAAFATRPERKHGRLPARWRVFKKTGVRCRRSLESVTRQ